MWDVLVELGIELLALDRGKSSPKRIAKQRAKGRITAHTRVTVGRVAGLKPFWESQVDWRVEPGTLRRRDRALAVARVDDGERVPTSVEEQVVGSGVSVLTLRTVDAVIEIALSAADVEWMRARLAGAPVVESA